jgi:tetratricopeptide (TPR) repeat protein
VANAAPKGEAVADGPAEKRARAHAHYGAGVIHEMNDEPGAALQEYYLAALDDPDDEWLLLEVSRRLLQNKQPEKALEILKPAAARPNASGEILARLSLTEAALGKHDEAVAAARAAIKRDPKGPGGLPESLPR